MGLRGIVALGFDFSIDGYWFDFYLGEYIFHFLAFGLISQSAVFSYAIDY